MTVTDCPTCGHKLADQAPPRCEAIHPTRALRCELPKGHLSAYHWHRHVLPDVSPVMWLDDEDDQQ